MIGIEKSKRGQPSQQKHSAGSIIAGTYLEAACLGMGSEYKHYLDLGPIAQKDRAAVS